MTINANRVQPGVPTGGQFATSARSEADVQLAAPGERSYARSADRPDAETWQHPAGVPRFDAITAYDDEARTFTIGDDLHVKGPWSARPDWIDSARPVLASLHRAGLTGDVEAHAWDQTSASREDWQLQAPLLPQKGSVVFEVRRTLSGHTRLSVVGETTRLVSAPGNADLDQDDVDAALDAVVRSEAIMDTWRRQITASPATRAFAVSRPGLMAPSTNPSLTRLSMQATGLTDVVATIEDGKVVSLHTNRAGAIEEPVDREASLALLGRAMGLPGGRKAGVPAQVEAMLAAAADTDSHPSVIAVRQARDNARSARA